jgi:hypothetical protein
VRAVLGRQDPAIEAGLPAAHVSRQRPGGGAFEAHALHDDGITPAEVHLVAGSRANRTAGELLQVQERRVPLRFVGVVAAVVEDVLRRPADVHFVLDDRFHAALSRS